MAYRASYNLVEVYDLAYHQRHKIKAVFNANRNLLLCLKFGSLLVVPAGWDALSLKWCSNPGTWSSPRRVNQSNWLISAKFTAIAFARLNSMSHLRRTPKKPSPRLRKRLARLMWS